MPMEDSVVDAPAPNENHGNPETTVEQQNVQVELHNDIENQGQQSPGGTPLLGNSNSDQQHEQQHLATQEQPIITLLQSSNLQRLFEIVPFARNYYHYFTARQQQVSSQEEEEELSRAVEVVTNISTLLIQSLTSITVGAIITAQLSPKILRNPGYKQIMFTEMQIQYVAVLFMMLGMYQQVRRKRLSKWLQCIGHLLSLDGFLIIGAVWLGLPQTLLPIPLLLIDLLLFMAM